MRKRTRRRKLTEVIDPGGFEEQDLLEHGAEVEVRQRFDGKWSKGFVVESANAEGYTVRRVHDDVLLPERFATDDVRHAKRHRLLWWT